MLERFNEEIKRRTRVVRIFPNRASCLKVLRALKVETHEDWLEGKPLSEYGSSQRTQKTEAEPRSLKSRRRTAAPRRLRAILGRILGGIRG